MSESLADPVLNGPYDPPTRHFEIGEHGPTGQILAGRRRSESFVPIAQSKKVSKKVQQLPLQDDLLSTTHEQVAENNLINDIRRAVERWRLAGFPHTTRTTLKLIRHWEDPTRENRVLFCQREAAETAIFLAEVAGRHGFSDWRALLAEQNAVHNDGLPRVALKMATGAGKTVVMAMLIAWHTLNKVASPSDARFAKRFLVVTPGITIRDRLQVLNPADPNSYYRLRDLVPPDLETDLGRAEIIITNYHSFLARDAKEIKGVASNTRKILLGHRPADADPFKESPQAVVSRVLRGWTSGNKSEIVVFNDEAHHCYADKEPEAARGDVDADAKEANRTARVWFQGLQAVAKHVGVKSVYDLSATPFYLRGSGYAEGFIFPWVVSDFSLMDAIESGIVKVPRTPVDDDATNDFVTYLNLWDSLNGALPTRAKSDLSPETWDIPVQLEGALQSLYRSYQQSYEHWRQNLEAIGEPPPVMIVVCSNTVVSRLVHAWIAGYEKADGTLVPGKLPLFSNIADQQQLSRRHTIVVDSVQLESGAAITGEFRKAAAEEIAVFKNDMRLRNPGLDVDTITDEDLLREVMNTVGKKGRLGEPVRCVVSVAMLTEGWDATTVTHILGIRAFRSQLLCEQVVGRGLRRRSYAVNEHGRFDTEYASVYGVPFAFIPNDKPLPPPKPPSPTVEVYSMPERDHLRIRFPRVTGYRLEIPDEDLHFDPATTPRYRVGRSAVPTWTESSPIVGEVERIEAEQGTLRPRAVAFRLAHRLLRHQYLAGTDERPWLFPKLVRICQQWLSECVDLDQGFDYGPIVRYAEFEQSAAEAVYGAITSQVGSRRERMRVVLHPDAYGDTGSVRFMTTKQVVPTTRSEVNRVVLDGPRGNTWEERIAQLCEDGALPVHSYVKNDRLGFTIPYVFKGKTHEYVPDFLLRLTRRGDDVERTLVVEVSGGMKSAHSPGSVAQKAKTARDSWCAGVNNHRGFGRWAYVEITDISTAADVLRDACQNLYVDRPIIGDPDLIDFQEVRRGA